MFGRGLLHSPQGNGSKVDSSGASVLTHQFARHRVPQVYKLHHFITQESEVVFFITILNCSKTHRSTVVFINYCACTEPVRTRRVVTQLVEALHQKTGVPGSKIVK